MRPALLRQLSVISEEEERLLAGEALDRSLYTDVRDFVIDPAKMLSTGQLIALRPHTRFVDFPAHRHDFVEIMYMIQGSTTHLLDETPVELRAGELLLMNQAVTQAIKRAGADDIAVNFLCLPPFFDYALALAGTEHPVGQFIISTLRQHSDPSYMLFKVADAWRIQNLVENLIGSLLEGTDHRSAKATMGLLFLELLGQTEHLEMPPANRLVADALQEVELHYIAPNLGRVAQKHHVSLAYVSSLVKDSSGKTFTEHLQAKRLSLAAAYLRHTDMSVEDILNAVGYSNTSYFYRIFREAYGQTPRQYRLS